MESPRKRERREKRTNEIMALTAKGFVVEALTPYQFRVNEVVDLYPVHRRYHALEANQRGTYESALAIVQQVIGKS
jgi:hypothetical protein